MVRLQPGCSPCLPHSSYTKCWKLVCAGSVYFTWARAQLYGVKDAWIPSPEYWGSEFVASQRSVQKNNFDVIVRGQIAWDRARTRAGLRVGWGKVGARQGLRLGLGSFILLPTAIANCPRTINIGVTLPY